MEETGELGREEGGRRGARREGGKVKGRGGNWNVLEIEGERGEEGKRERR